MSGHSKWHNIRVKKTAEDAKRGKVYTRHARLIEMAARAGGDPVTNSALRMAIENAKMDDVPNANIDRAIKKGSGETKGEQMAEAMYAAYGPGGVACLIECLTDNKNRTVSNVKSAVTNHGGNWAEVGSVAWMFARKGLVVAKQPAAGLTPQAFDELELQLIDLGAEDVARNDDTVSVTTDLTGWSKVRDALKNKGFAILEAGLKYVPTQTQTVTDEATASKLMAFVEVVEEDDDVSEVHTNADVPDAMMASLH
jgi:YebC/PmpR family DNA-binding regulatory protein